MKFVTRSFVQATLAMTGTIIGAGIFGLPAAFSRIGFVWGTILYLGLACIVTAMHLLYVEVHLAVGHTHRLSGAANRILGPFFGKIAAITYPAYIFGTCLIYILLGGEFLASLFSFAGLSIPVRIVQVVYWLVVSLLVYRNLRSLARVETYATGVLILLLLLVSVLAWKTSGGALGPLLFARDGSFIPLGVLLFSLTGLPVVGEVVELVRHDRSRAYHAVLVGTLLAALLSWIFGVSWALIIASSSGREMLLVIPPSLKIVGVLLPMVGFFAVITSYLTSAKDLFAVFQKDFGWRKHQAWIAAVVPPLIFLFIFKQDLLHLMDIIGGIFSAFNAALVCLMALVLALRSSQRTNWVIGVSALITGMVFMTILFQKLSSFLPPSV